MAWFAGIFAFSPLGAVLVAVGIKGDSHKRNKQKRHVVHGARGLRSKFTPRSFCVSGGNGVKVGRPVSPSQPPQ